MIFKKECLFGALVGLLLFSSSAYCDVGQDFKVHMCVYLPTQPLSPVKFHFLVGSSHGLRKHDFDFPDLVVSKQGCTCSDYEGSALKDEMASNAYANIGYTTDSTAWSQTAKIDFKGSGVSKVEMSLGGDHKGISIGSTPAYSGATSVNGDKGYVYFAPDSIS